MWPDIAFVVFHVPGEPAASPALYGIWEKSPVTLLKKARVFNYPPNAELACAEFFKWCVSRKVSPLSEHAFRNLSGVPWVHGKADLYDWYDRCVSAISNVQLRVFLVDLDNRTISERKEVVYRAPTKRQVDRRVRVEGQPFPVGWFGQDLGEYRKGDGTYVCYPPDALPPLRIKFSGSFHWLANRRDYDRSIAANSRPNNSALKELKSSKASIPRSFSLFFRTPKWWKKIQSCTDCYLHLDPKPVGIPNGLGKLIRFMSDSQDCKHWHLWITSSTTEPAVVATYEHIGSDHVVGPFRHDITVCAASFEEFMYRFWLENEIWFALNGKGVMPEGAEEYLAFYSNPSA